MTEIDYSRIICQFSALKRVQVRANTLNDAMPAKTFKKVVNGEERTYQRKPKAVTAGVKDTMAQLIKNYKREHHRLLDKVGPPAFEQGMPPLRVCRHSLSDQRTVSEKTVYNHVSKLKALGFITNYKFRGSRHAFEVWIDPALLFQPERVVEATAPSVAPDVAQSSPQPPVDALNEGKNQPRKFASLLPQTANFTAYKVTVTSENKETDTKNDRIEHSDAPGKEHGNKNHSNPEQQQPNLAQRRPTTAVSSEGHSDLGAGGAGRGPECRYVDNAGGQPTNPNSAGQRAKRRLTKGAMDAQRAAGRTPEQHRAILEGYLASFWRYAKQTLYPGRAFAEWEEPVVLATIRRGVYKNFEPVLTEREWDQYQSELYKQVDLAANYYQRHPTKWIPAPYAQHREGAGYFDRENSRGFIITRTWLRENQRLYRETYVSQRISLAVRHLQLHRAGKAPKTIQNKPYIEAYRLIEARIAKYGEVAQDRFNALVSTIGEQKPKLTPGFAKIFKK